MKPSFCLIEAERNVINGLYREGKLKTNPDESSANSTCATQISPTSAATRDTLKAKSLLRQARDGNFRRTELGSRIWTGDKWIFCLTTARLAEDQVIR
jgi:uncharacterized protein (DUF2237 family)